MPLPPAVSPGRGSRTIVGVFVVLLIAIVTVLVSWHPPWAGSLGSWLRRTFAPMFERRWTGPRLFLAACSVAFAGVSVVVVHEAGHVLAGLWAGFGFQTIAIGPIRLDRGFRISLHRGTHAWSGGWVGMFPVKRDRLRCRALALVFAGPASPLLCGCVLLMLPFPKGFGSATFIAGSILGAVIELLPIRSGGVAFDGWRIWKLLLNREWSTRWPEVKTRPPRGESRASRSI
jgi:hypothetical protein